MQIDPNLPQFATHPLQPLVYSANRHAIRFHGRVGTVFQVGSCSWLVLPITDSPSDTRYFSILLNDPRAPRCPPSFQILLLNAIRNQCGLGYLGERERGRFGAHANGGLPCAGTRTESCNCEARRSQDMTSRALCWNPGGGVTGIEMRSDE